MGALELHEQRVEHGVEVGWVGREHDAWRVERGDHAVVAAVGIGEHAVAASEVVGEPGDDQLEGEVGQQVAAQVVLGFEPFPQGWQRELHLHHRGVGIGEHDRRRLGVRRQAGVGAKNRVGQGRSARGERTEPVADVVEDVVGVEVAHHDHRRVVGPVPLVVEVPEQFGGHRLDRRLVADRIVPLVRRSGEVLDLQAVGDAPAVALLALAPLVEHDPGLGGDLLGIQGGGGQPLGQDVEPRGEVAAVCEWNAQLVDGLVIARVGVHVGTEVHAEVAQRRHQLVAGKLFGAVEQHVFQEVGHTVLVRCLVHRPGIDHQAHLGVAPWGLVLAHVDAQPVGERFDVDGLVDREPPRAVRRRGAGAAAGLRTTTGARRGDQRSCDGAPYDPLQAPPPNHCPTLATPPGRALPGPGYRRPGDRSGCPLAVAGLEC